MTDVATQVRLAALEAIATSLSAHCTYLQTLVSLQGKAAIEGIEAARKEIQLVQRWMDDLDDDMDEWANEP